MAHVVFLRAANVGGKNVFRPAQLAAALKHLDVVNVGAAGTFVVRAPAPAARIRQEFRARLPLELAMVVVPAREVLALVRARPFDGVVFSKELRGWVAVLHGRATFRPALPISAPAAKDWSVRLDRVSGRFALGLWRRQASGFVFPGHVVETALGPPATMRWWETLERVAGIARSVRSERSGSDA